MRTKEKYFLATGGISKKSERDASSLKYSHRSWFVSYFPKMTRPSFHAIIECESRATRIVYFYDFRICEYRDHCNSLVINYFRFIIKSIIAIARIYIFIILFIFVLVFEKTVTLRDFSKGWIPWMISWVPVTPLR